jgi:hypothetical protein
MDPAAARPLTGGYAAAAFHPSSAADASAAAVILSVLGPFGSERFLLEKGRECFPEGLHAQVFSPGPSGGLAASSLTLDPGGRLHAARNYPHSPRRSHRPAAPGGIPLLPLSAFSS